MVLQFDRNSRQSGRRGESARLLRAHDRRVATEDRRLARLLGVQPDELTEETRCHTEAILAIERAYAADRKAGREALVTVLSGYYSDGYQNGLADETLDCRRLK